LVFDDGLSLKQQIRQYAFATALVLGHGAGMLHLLWMKPSSLVVELIPALKVEEDNGAAQGCKRLADLLKFDFKRVVVSGDHTKVDPQKVVKIMQEWTGKTLRRM
jgi:hypothetical protein